MPVTEPLAFFVTFRTYATWLHGDERGSVDRQHNHYQTPFVPPNAQRVENERTLAGPMFELEDRGRAVVDRTIREVCSHSRWSLAALNVRTNHVHAVVSAPVGPERVMTSMKSWSTRRLREAGLVEADRTLWARHGSTRWIWTARALERAVRYTLLEQGDGVVPDFESEAAS
ncbi:MAG: transposase [Phycisphaerales bacterium]|nr:transposase [Phycisphaerales bacterium]